MPASAYDLADRILGSYVGGAIGDALGGPVEGWHAGEIKRVYGRIEGLLPYDPARLQPGYANHAAPGSITDDTYMKSAIARFLIDHPDQAARTPERLAAYMHEVVDPSWCLPVRLEPLKRIHAAEVTPYQSADTHRVGGIGAWWSPAALVRPGRAAEAYEEASQLSLIWKRPLERDLIGAFQAGIAVALTDGATVDLVVETILGHAGPLGSQLFSRAVDLARSVADGASADLDTFSDAVYRHLLVVECSTKVDGPLPEPAEAEPTPRRQRGNLLAEQLPLALATVVFGRGDFVRTMTSGVALGRDTDSHCTNAAALIGALAGLSAIPADWVDTIIAANPELDLLGTARALAGLAMTPS